MLADQKPSFVEFILDENLKEVRDHPEVLAYESDKGFGVSFKHLSLQILN